MSPEVTSTKQLTLLTSIITPGSTTGLHKHESDEFMYVATGRGEFIEEGRSESFEPDSVLFGPVNKEHEVKNTGKETLKLICIYSPPLRPMGFFQQAVELAARHRQGND
jgi:mannose-6-phosphate isomerase-like protein (cupin superfamily)